MSAAAFLSPLQQELIDDAGAGRYRLTAPLRFDSKVLGRVVEVPKGFETDHASVPRLPIAWWLTGGTADRPAVVHDYLLESGFDRATADKVFREAMAATGVPWWRRALMFAGVRLYGIIF